MLYGLLHLSFWQFVFVTFLLTHITIVSVSIYLHRGQAHRSLEFHPVISHFFRFWLWLTTGMNTKAWTAIHRKHHAKCETHEDPHSPKILGLDKVLWEGTELYRKEALNQETLNRYGQGTPDDWIENHLYTPHSSAGIALMLVIDILLFGIPGISLWAIQMAWVPFFGAGVVNGIGHYWGYRNYECPEAARNIMPWGFLMGGEELHNNHHTFASAAKFSDKWWEFDVSWYYIKFLCMLHLAKVKKLPPKLIISADKKTIDDETVNTIIINRFRILTLYCKEVVAPTLIAEKRSANKITCPLFRLAPALFIRNVSLLNEAEKNCLTQLLDKYPTIRHVYDYGLRLQEIWGCMAASQRELQATVKKWCEDAEYSNILALSTFAQHLKTFSTVMV